MNNLLNDISTLTNIPFYILNELSDKSILSISHSVYEGLLENEPLTEIDIGIGTLYIKLEDANIKYKFIPSKKLEKEVAETISSKQSPLVKEVDDSFRSKIDYAYKKLL